MFAGPGQHALTRMESSASSSARTRVSAFTAALRDPVRRQALAHRGKGGQPAGDVDDPPVPARPHQRHDGLVCSRIVPMRLVSMARRTYVQIHAGGGCPWSCSEPGTAALFTRRRHSPAGVANPASFRRPRHAHRFRPRRAGATATATPPRSSSIVRTADLTRSRTDRHRPQAPESRPAAVPVSASSRTICRPRPRFPSADECLSAPAGPLAMSVWPVAVLSGPQHQRRADLIPLGQVGKPPGGGHGPPGSACWT
jgi:hypothetical protein